MKKNEPYPFYNDLEDNNETEDETSLLKVDTGSFVSHQRTNSEQSTETDYATPYQSHYTEKKKPPAHVNNPLESSTLTVNLESQNSANSTMKESSQSNLSYSAYQKQQTALPNKWLREINVSPYFTRIQNDSQKEESLLNPVGFIAQKLNKSFKRESSPSWEMQETKKDSTDPQKHKKDQMLEGLLPQTSFDNSNRSEYISTRTRKDLFFSILFSVSFFIMMVVGMVYVFQFPNEMRNKIIFSSSIYRAIVESASLFASVISVSLAVAILWAILIKSYTKEIVMAMIGFIPAALFVLFLWSFVSAFIGPRTAGGYLLAQDAWLIPISLSLLATSALFVFFIRKNRNRIDTTIKITQMATLVLFENLSIFVLSFGMLVIYSMFAVVWLTFFSHLSFLGYASGEGDNIRWNLNIGSYWIQLFFIFMFLWTTSIFTNIQRSVIGGVVCQWYFLRHQPNYKLTNPVMVALRNAVTYSFGQISLASLILSTVTGSRMMFRTVRQATKNSRIPFVSSTFSVISFVIGFVEKLIEHISQFALYYVALKGESFFKSGKAICRIFRRNLLLGFTTAHLILSASALVTALISGLATFVFAAHVLESSYGWYVGMLFSVVAWYMMQFFTNIIGDTIDATFMCYAIDLDSEKVRCQVVHEAFGKQTYTN